jgi:hypothetical protein
VVIGLGDAAELARRHIVRVFGADPHEGRSRHAGTARQPGLPSLAARKDEPGHRRSEVLKMTCHDRRPA